MVTPSQPSLGIVGDARREIAVLTVDDQACFRDALRDVIAATDGFVLVGEACTGEEAVSAADVLSPDVVLMDVRMPGMNGVAAAHTIMTRRPSTLVVLISAEDPDQVPGAETLGDSVTCVSKQLLRPQALRDIWDAASQS